MLKRPAMRRATRSDRRVRTFVATSRRWSWVTASSTLHYRCRRAYSRQSTDVPNTGCRVQSRSLFSLRNDDSRLILPALKRVDVLIIDELGFVPFDRTGGDAILQSHYRSLRAPLTVVTTNLFAE